MKTKTRRPAVPHCEAQEHFWVQIANYGKLRVFRCANCKATAGLVGADEL